MQMRKGPDVILWVWHDTIRRRELMYQARRQGVRWMRTQKNTPHFPLFLTKTPPISTSFTKNTPISFPAYGPVHNDVHRIRTIVTSCYSMGSQRPHRCCPPANKVDYRQVWACRIFITSFPPQCVTTRAGIGSPFNTWFIGSTRVHILNVNSIGSAVFAWLTESRRVKQTHRPPITTDRILVLRACDAAI